MKVVTLILAGGTGNRMNSTMPKQFILVNNKPIIIYSLETFQQHPLVDHIICICLKEYKNQLYEYIYKYHITKCTLIINGGATRQESIINGTLKCKELYNDDDIILYHDAARPLISSNTITNVINLTKQYGCATPVCSCTSTMLETNDNLFVNNYYSRDKLKIAQSPIGYSLKELHSLTDFIIKNNITNLTDIGVVLPLMNKSMALCNDSSYNIKITMPEDITLFKALLALKSNNSWLNLKDKTAIVTGAASGIGKVIAQTFLNHGVNVIACDINPNKPIFNITETSGKIKYIITDITNIIDINNMIKNTINTFNKIDILVNNAGVNIPALLVDPTNLNSIYEINENIYDKITNINIKGTYLVTQAVSREMIKANNGVIINISSECGLEGSEGQSIYAATKNAINSFTRSWCKELGKYNIRVVGLAPGIIEPTRLRTSEYEKALAYTRNISIKELNNNYSNIKTIPLGRIGKLTEIADTVMFLASERSSYINGITINISGGKSRG